MIRHRMHDLRTWSQAAPNGERARRRRGHCVLEGLEDRILLSGTPTMYLVDLTSDTGAKTSTDEGDLLYCITQANANPNTAGSEITFDQMVFSATAPQTIKLSKTLELTETAGPELIEGPGASVVTISGNNAVEVFDDPQENVTATLLGLTISGGMTNGSGGGINNDGTLTVTNSTIENNAAEFGAGIYNDGILTVTGSMVETNSATEFAGGIDNADGGTVTLTNTTVAKNSAVHNGGGILNLGGSTLTLTDGAVSDNSAISGGGIDNNNSKLTVTGSTLSGNDSTGTKSSDGGGGVYESGGTASITGSTLSGNSAVAGGGGIYEGAGALTIAASTLSDNSVSGPSGPGGGIDENAGTLTLTNSTIAGNTAPGFGAGVQENQGALTAVNCTIAYNYEHFINHSGFGGGMNITQGPVTLDNTIIALNTEGPGLGGPADNLYSEGNPVSSASAYNLIGPNGNPGLTNGTNHNQVGVANPLLGTLANNGGPTETIALLAHSLAIDAGSNSLAVDRAGKHLATDQRGAGFPRIVNGTVDIGAFERPIVTAGPTVYMVDLTSDSGASTSALAGDLLYCITQANASTSLAGDEIEFSQSVFKAATPQTITLTSSLELSEPSGPETIVGPGANLVTVSGNKAVEVFDVQEAAAMAALSGLTIADGTAGSGGGIGNAGVLTVTACDITENTAGGSGGGIANSGILTITNTDVGFNSAVDSGGGIDNTGMLTLGAGSASSNNTAGGSGAGIDSSGTLAVTDSAVSSNKAKASGGGIDSSGTLEVTDSTLSHNSAGSGGAIYNNGGGDSIAGSTFSQNFAATGGGGIFTSAGALTITDCTITRNECQEGAGIFIQTLSELTLTGSTIANNTADFSGAGIYSAGTVTITNSTVARNSAGYSPAPAGYGGGVYVAGGGLTAVNCTIADNNVTVATGFGGGVDIAGGTVTLYNTIVALNLEIQSGRADDIAGTVSPTSEFNLIGTGGAGGLMDLVNHNHVGVADPGINPPPPNELQDNGGPTQTIALLATSPAIDNGSATITGITVPGTDQRGFPRTGGIDIGAFQAGDPVPTITYVNIAWASDPAGTTVTWTDGSTHYVDYDAFGTVQGGVNGVAAGGTVDVAAGTYTEQVAITNSLTLTGAGAAGTTIQAPASLSSGDEVSIAGGDHVSLSGFTVSGTGAATGVGDNGGTITASGVTVTGFSTGVAVGDNGAATITDSAIISDGTGISLGSSAGDTSSATASDDDFSGDATGVASVQSGGSTSATSDWWGSLHGPTTAVNPGGNGAAAGSNINFSPWIGVYTNNAPAGQPGFEPAAITLYAVPTKLVFSTEPSTTAGAGVALATQPVVEAQDAGDNLGINFDSSTVSGSEVSLTLNAGMYLGALTGSSTLNATGGYASFSGLGITEPGTYTLTASALGAPWSGLSTGTSTSTTVSAPVPSLTSISPNRIAAGSAGPITLTVTGSGFIGLSVVDWNSTALATSYVSPTELTATVPASDFASVGTATITVTNPAPGGGTSTGVTFQVFNSPPTPERILGEVPVFKPKTHNKGKPVLTGFTLDLSAPLNSVAASNPANYQIDTVTTKKVKKTVKRTLHPITNFTVSYTPASLALTVKLGSTQTFPTGGQITVLPGVTAGSGTVLEGTTVFAVSKGGKSITPE